MIEELHSDVCINAISGFNGLRPTLQAIKRFPRIGLANKETIVAAGEIVKKSAAEQRCEIIPVDSEHSGVFQCLAGRRSDEIVRLWLTASGGPFRSWTKEQIENASLGDALKHPTWSMGAKITIDSASMMNKALELVEARYLFDVPGDRLGAVIEPHSTVHALVELADGSSIAQLAEPDMRLPIRYALTYPERLSGHIRKFDFSALGKIEFFPVDAEKFPALDFARYAIDCGGTMPAVMNAANEVAVERFRSGEIKFSHIWKIVRKAMEHHKAEPQKSIEQLENADREARIYARNIVC
jgi:1-deoxy-D-xylulose-5-phosphate reductoisomerase